MGVKGISKHSDNNSIVIILPKINPHDNFDELAKLDLEFIINEFKGESSANV